MSGHATMEDATAAMRAGVLDLLRKPFRLAEAVRTVGAAMDRAHARRQAADARALEERRLRDAEDARRDQARRFQDAQDVLRRAIEAGPSERFGDARDLDAVSDALRDALQALRGALPPGAAAGALHRLDEAVRVIEEVWQLRTGLSPAVARPLGEAEVAALLGAAPPPGRVGAITAAPERLRRIAQVLAGLLPAAAPALRRSGGRLAAEFALPDGASLARVLLKHLAQADGGCLRATGAGLRLEWPLAGG